MTSWDAVVVGAGAAGLMCAIEAGKRGKRVLILEHGPEAGRKILISGGGRCNFTNLYCEPENFLSANPHFAKSALARYTPDDFLALVRKHRIAFHEKKLGQLFCDGSARQIVDLLLTEGRSAAVRIVTDCTVASVSHDSEFLLETNIGPQRSTVLVIATGGLSIPKIGATGFGYDIAKQFGLKIQECRPALVPFIFGAEDRTGYCDLAGVSAEVAATVRGQAFREKMLVTHRGLSGPVILQISSYWTPGDQVTLDLLPGIDLASVENERIIAAEHLPARFLNRWIERNGYPKPPLAWGLQHRTAFQDQIHAWRVSPNGTEGYPKAEVTAGGVDTDELSSKTMESRKVKGLFFVGEVVDVTGHLGGFNFQWAWASGFAAGQAI